MDIEMIQTHTIIDPQYYLSWALLLTGGAALLLHRTPPLSSRPSFSFYKVTWLQHVSDLYLLRFFQTQRPL